MWQLKSGPGRPGAGVGASLRRGCHILLAVLAATAIRPAADDLPQAWAEEGALKIAFNFKNEKSISQMALTRDSVGILALDSSAGALEPDDENGFESALTKRALTSGERDTADMLLAMTRSWKGRKRYFCASKDDYAFTIWSDSLTLHCENCFSCTEGISLPEAKMLAKFGKLTLWLYRIKGGMAGQTARLD